MALKLFVDFDGTITQCDVGNAFFEEFGGMGCAALVAAYKAGRISAKELFRKEIEALGVLDEARAAAFFRAQQIDRSFIGCVEFCRARDIKVSIVSDGLDYYIGRILAFNGVPDVSFFANHVETSLETGGTRLAVSFPYDDAECTRCACCKRNIMLSSSSDEDIIVYVGEGYSDRCPVRYADVVFAKDALQRFCQEENISYFMYNTFDDVVQRLDALLAKPNLKPRREAMLKRREAFMAE
jgi:2-hydroxy-3-keto-5-methylthiopentenyl-1-phosphate phosphatase